MPLGSAPTFRNRSVGNSIAKLTMRFYVVVFIQRIAHKVGHNARKPLIDWYIDGRINARAVASNCSKNHSTLAIRPRPSRQTTRLYREISNTDTILKRISSETWTHWWVYLWLLVKSGCSSTVEQELPKLKTRVQLPSPAPFLSIFWF